MNVEAFNTFRRHHLLCWLRALNKGRLPTKLWSSEKSSISLRQVTWFAEKRWIGSSRRVMASKSATQNHANFVLAVIIIIKLGSSFGKGGCLIADRTALIELKSQTTNAGGLFYHDQSNRWTPIILRRLQWELYHITRPYYSVRFPPGHYRARPNVLGIISPRSTS